jgi:hypothetical protein
VARRIPGLRPIGLARRERDHDVEFITLMWSDTLDSVKQFMSEDFEVAHVPPRAQAVFSDFDQRPAHHEMLDRRGQPLQPAAQISGSVPINGAPFARL